MLVTRRISSCHDKRVQEALPASSVDAILQWRDDLPQTIRRRLSWINLLERLAGNFTNKRFLIP